MTIDLDLTPLSYQSISEKANEFLLQYNREGVFPVPIEEIVEFCLRVDIIPVYNLQRDFETEGFTSSDLKSIYVDEFILSKRLYRYRFTLAHEAGHIFLHRNIFENIRIQSVTDLKSFIEEINQEDYSWLEYQGYSFAGLLLVPPAELKRRLCDHLGELEPFISTCRQRKIAKKDYLGPAKEFLAGRLSPEFDVSTGVIIKRIEKDKLELLIP